MKLYSSAEEPIVKDPDTREQPSHYNWLVILIIFIAYMVFAMVAW